MPKSGIISSAGCLYFSYETPVRSISHSYGFSPHHGHWIREEAAMAAIIFDHAHQIDRTRKQLENALAAYREMLNRFVSNQIRQAATEAGQVRPRRRPDPSSPSKNTQ
jgi:hypothetical protein